MRCNIAILKSSATMDPNAAKRHSWALTNNVDQDQTVQNVKCDLGPTLSGKKLLFLQSLTLYHTIRTFDDPN